MTVQISVALANALLDAIPATQGPNARFQVWSGAPGALPEDTPAGVLLVDMALPIAWLSTASAGVASKAGDWSGVTVSDGNAGCYRLTTAAGIGFSTGTVGVDGSDTDAWIGDKTALVAGETVRVTQFDLKFPGF